MVGKKRTFQSFTMPPSAPFHQRVHGIDSFSSNSLTDSFLPSALTLISANGWPMSFLTISRSCGITCRHWPAGGEALAPGGRLRVLVVVLGEQVEYLVVIDARAADGPGENVQRQVVLGVGLHELEGPGHEVAVEQLVGDRLLLGRGLGLVEC